MDNDFEEKLPKYIPKLKNLLQTNDPANAELAFQLMRAKGIPEILHPESINTSEKVMLCLKYQFQKPLKHVKKLDLSNCENEISDRFENIALLENLEYLELSRKSLSNIPEGVFELKKLRILHLRANQLTYISPEIHKLKNLRQLNLAGNLLRTLPEEIGDLPLLEYLTLTSNQIQGLPESINRLQNLRKLVLWNNPLSKYEIDKIKSVIPHVKIELEVNNLY